MGFSIFMQKSIGFFYLQFGQLRTKFIIVLGSLLPLIVFTFTPRQNGFYPAEQKFLHQVSRDFLNLIISKKSKISVLPRIKRILPDILIFLA